MSVDDFGLNKRRRDIVSQLFEQVAGCPCIWSTDPDQQFEPISKAKITLRIRDIESPDVWEQITSNSATATNTQLGNQSVASIEVKIESFDVEVNAHQIYQKLATRLYRDKFRAILHTANCAIGDNDDLNDLPTTYDNRVVSACIGAIRLAFADVDPVTDQNDTWIQTVNQSSTGTGNCVIIGTYGNDK